LKSIDEFRLDLSDAAIEVGRNLLNDCTLEEREFGRLAEVVDALRISSSHSIPNQTHQGINIC
jgi:hypothetical protein